MLVRDAIKVLLDCPMTAKIVVLAYEDGPKDEEGEPPSNYHSAVSFAPKPFSEDDPKTIYLYTYPERWK